MKEPVAKEENAEDVFFWNKHLQTAYFEERSQDTTVYQIALCSVKYPSPTLCASASAA